MRFRLLGTVEIRTADAWVRLERPRRRAVLAYLLLAGNRMVTSGELVEAIWGPLPPSTARSQTQNDIAAIRKALLGGGPSASIVTRTGGYELVTEPDDVDYQVFRRRVAAATAAAQRGDPSVVAHELRAGLALWRGPVLADVVAAFVEPTRVRIEDQRLDAIERLAEARIAMGGHDEQIPVLRELLGDQPQRERSAALLMLALYQAGRSADALAVARDLREHLREQHGLDPSQAVVDMERRILRNTVEVRPDGAAAPPRRIDQLPMDARVLTGREAELAELSALVRRPGGDRLVLITGTAGVGKTALAVRWGHQQSALFPDGALFVDLRGYDRRRPLTPTEALHKALTGLGVDAPQLPSDPDDASALFRSLTANVRCLVVLDNARSAEQVRPLLPGGGSCFVVVTSRDSLPGLVASHSVTRIDLPVLGTLDGVRILEQVIGAARTSAEAASAAALVALCGGLPLAIRIVAADLCDAPGRTLARQEALLRESRLSALDNRGDSEAGVRSVLQTTYDTLAKPGQRLFRLLSVLPYAEVDAVIAAGADGRDQAAVRADLDHLVGVHLLERRTAGRYGFHDLPRAFAAEQAESVETAAQRADALGGALAGYRRLLDEASTILYPQAMRLVDGATSGAPESSVAGHFADAVDARSWITVEYSNLLTSVSLAHEQGFHDAAWRIAVSLRSHYLAIGAWHDLSAAASVAVAAATLCGDKRGEALARLGKADALRRQAEHDLAIEEYGRALRLAEADGWAECQAAVLGNLGIVHLRQGQLALAATYYTRDLEICRRIGWTAAQVVALGNLGNCTYHMGRYADAVRAFEGVVALARQTSSAAGEALAWFNIGSVSIDRGDPVAARPHLERALAIYTDLGRTADMISAHAELARSASASGDLTTARRHLQRTRDLVAQLGDGALDPSLHCQVRICAAAVHAAGGELAEAEAVLTEAVEQAETHRLVFLRCGAMIDLARVLVRLGRVEQARGYATTARTVCQSSELYGLANQAASVLESLTTL